MKKIYIPLCLMLFMGIAPMVDALDLTYRTSNIRPISSNSYGIDSGVVTFPDTIT